MGIRSPSSYARRITNWPGAADSATAGARSISRWMLGTIISLSRTSNIILPYIHRNALPVWSFAVGQDGVQRPTRLLVRHRGR